MSSMVFVLTVWVLAVCAGFLWSRKAVIIFTLVTVASLLLLKPDMLVRPVGYLQLLMFLITPWLLVLQRSSHDRRLKRSRTIETFQKNRVSEIESQLNTVNLSIQMTESQIEQITDLYHITKETARALHVEELFNYSIEIIPDLLDIEGMRIIDLSGSSESPVVLRARRTQDGRLKPDETGPPRPVEQAILSSALQSGMASCSLEANLSGKAAQEETSRKFAWAPLWAEQKPIGVLIADDLPENQLSTLSIIANQLSLQLTRIHFYQKVESMAVTDTLTQTFVRRYFLEFAAEELLRSKRHSLSCAFLMVDLDHFKQKNDTYGHLVGDVVLREVAQLMKRNLRGIDLIARYGGEEFILLLLETAEDQAAAVAERLRQMVEVQQIRAYDEVLSQTISIGLACFPKDGGQLQEMIDRADEALYVAKRTGRNRVVLWSVQDKNKKTIRNK